MGVRFWIQQGLGILLLIAGVAAIPLGQSVMAPVPIAIGSLLLVGPRWNFRQIYRKQLADAGEITMEIAETGFNSSGSYGSGHLNWSAFASFFETKNLFVLLRKGNVLVLVPKRSMSPQAVEEFRTLLRASVVLWARSGNTYRWLLLAATVVASVVLIYFAIHG